MAQPVGLWHRASAKTAQITRHWVRPASVPTEAFEVGAVGFGEAGFGEEVGTVAEGFCEGALAAPAADGVVVALGEDLRDGDAAEVGGAGVVGVVEESAGTVGGGGRRMGAIGRVLVGRCAGGGVGCAEALEFAGGFVAEDAGDEAGGGIDHDGRGQFASGEDVVANGELAVAKELVDALVDAFVAAAEEDDAIEGGQVAGYRLGEAGSLGREQDDLGGSGGGG